MSRSRFQLLWRRSQHPQDNLVGNLVKSGQYTEEELQDMASRCRPILLREVRSLIEKYMEIKREIGLECEKALYANMSVEDFITRVFECRPLGFVGGSVCFVACCVRCRDHLPLPSRRAMPVVLPVIISIK